MDLLYKNKDYLTFVLHTTLIRKRQIVRLP